MESLKGACAQAVALQPSSFPSLSRDEECAARPIEEEQAAAGGLRRAGGASSPTVPQKGSPVWRKWLRCSACRKGRLVASGERLPRAPGPGAAEVVAEAAVAAEAMAEVAVEAMAEVAAEAMAAVAASQY